MVRDTYKELIENALELEVRDSAIRKLRKIFRSRSDTSGIWDCLITVHHFVLIRPTTLNIRNEDIYKGTKGQVGTTLQCIFAWTGFFFDLAGFFLVLF